jgi:MinD-like ATPase involved in chromosome partitioning or flagellar assembly
VSKFDYLLVDLPSVPTPAVQAAVPRSQAVVLVVEPVRDSVDRATAMASFLQSLAVPGTVVQAVVVTRAPIASPIGVAEIEERLALPVAGAIPPAPDACARAASLGRPILMTEPDGTTAAAVRQLAGILR